MTANTGAGSTTFETPSERELVLTSVFGAPRALVFDALTSPEHLPHWMLGPDRWTPNTLALAEEDGRTTLTQTILYPSPEARNAAAGSGMKEGVSLSFGRLDDRLEAIAR